LNSNTLEPDRPQRDRPATCVIAQHYSSGTYITLRYHCRKVKFGALFKDSNISIPLTFTPKFHKSETA
jgi:hypothetical protein